MLNRFKPKRDGELLETAIKWRITLR